MSEEITEAEMQSAIAAGMLPYYRARFRDSVAQVRFALVAVVVYAVAAVGYLIMWVTEGHWWYAAFIGVWLLLTVASVWGMRSWKRRAAEWKKLIND